MLLNKHTGKQYTIELKGKLMNIKLKKESTLEEFLEAMFYLSVEEFKNCFVCDKMLNKTETPYIVEIDGLEDRFCCAECYKNLEDIK